ncbi:NAD(P)-dependent oxidoreductase [Tissierella sp. Yu-01]|uniref:NAD-dependent epimerase/dehydratase family protein n=1 Tax=Tissierella sp. Yu-01 TaxID=3035694 RepID=UPI00240DCBD3|nr:NAD(P)-dependent oxidoreductase [Tissierella sp. Yu-01]WFA07916.1 NAD(P)-dependent oxidoreductase [Tissierella sp. Yu-01]
MDKKTAIITGATGYIGSKLAKKLVRDKWDVHLITRLESSFKYIEDITNDVNILIYDGNVECLIEFFNEVKPQVIFHLASLVTIEHTLSDVDALIESNIKFGTHILEAMLKSQVNILVNTGTSWQHYNNDDYNPVNLYAATKQAFESILKYYTESKGIKAITLELFDTFGPHDNRPKIINLLRKTYKNNTPLDMSLGEQLLDIVYIDDVIEAYITASNNLFKNENIKNSKYSVCTNKPINLKELVEKFEEVYATKLNINWGRRPYRNREVMITWNKGKVLPNWHPKISLEEGIRKLKEYD